MKAVIKSKITGNKKRKSKDGKDARALVTTDDAILRGVSSKQGGSYAYQS